MNKTLFDGDTFEHGGYTFRFNTERDEDMREPWKEHDGHGIVSEWTSRNKAPGERLLTPDHTSRRYYNVVETIKVAKRDGWGCDETELTRKLGRKPTRAEVTAEAVERDFRHLQAWCNDDWYWCYVEVTMLDENGDDTEFRNGIGGVESDAGDYLADLARENADECIAKYQKRMAKVLA